MALHLELPTYLAVRILVGKGVNRSIPAYRERVLAKDAAL